MAISKVWKVEGFDVRPTLNNLTNVISRVQWSVTIEYTDDNTNQILGRTVCNGYVLLDNPDPNNFIPADQATESQIIEWTKAALGEKVAEYESTSFHQTVNQNNNSLVRMYFDVNGQPVIVNTPPTVDSYLEVPYISGTQLNADNKLETTWSVRQTTQEEKNDIDNQLINYIAVEVQNRLDSFARTRGYDDIKSATGYSGCPISKFDVEGTYCRDVRAETWASLFQMLDEVNAGTRPKPTSIIDIEAELPVLAWPN